MDATKRDLSKPLKKGILFSLAIAAMSLIAMGALTVSALTPEVSNLITSDYQKVTFTTNWKTGTETLYGLDIKTITIRQRYFGTDPNHPTSGMQSYSYSNRHTFTVRDSGTYYFYIHVNYFAWIKGTINNQEGSLTATGGPVTFYKTRLNANGGQCDLSQVIVQAGQRCVFPNATREGYLFRGWSESSWSTSGITSYTPTGDDVYYACWEPDPNYRTSISDCSVTLNQTSYTYDGTAKQPSVTVSRASKVLSNGTDYTVSYSNNTNAGTAVATVTGIGSYNGVVKKSFTISTRSISSADLTLNRSSFEYDGTAKRPDVMVWDGKYLVNGTDYTVSYMNNVNVGTATVTITGTGNYSGSGYKNFTITEPAKIDLSSCAISLGQTSYTYDGTAKRPAVTVKNASQTLTEGKDYTLSYENNINAGIATVILEGKGSYTGTATRSFTVSPKPVSATEITLANTVYTYDGSEKKPVVIIRDGEKLLTENTDYVVYYLSNIHVGTAYIMVNGIGNYTGVSSKNFTIEEPEVVKPKQPVSYTITYHLNGGKNNSGNPKTYTEDSAEIVLKNPTRTGYTFAGWYSDAAFKTKVIRIKAGSTGNETLYAKWTGNLYTITYILNGGSNNKNNPKSYTVTDADFTLKSPTKKGYTFRGWYSDAAFKTRITKIKKGSAGNKSLYAKWTSNAYTITYHLKGGTNDKTNPKSYTVTDADIILKSPTKKGYTFKGWYSDAAFKNKVTKVTKGSSGNKTLYAKWTVNTYTITYHLNGGTNDKSNLKTFKTSTGAIRFKAPTRKGYIFLGWYSDAGCTKRVSGLKKGAAGNKTIYAKWSKKSQR